MKIQIEIKGRKTIVTYNGKTKEHETKFLNSLSYKDAINYLMDSSKY